MPTSPRTQTSEKGIQPLPDKVITIKNLAIPNNVDVLHFLGLTSYRWVPLKLDFLGA